MFLFGMYQEFMDIFIFISIIFEELSGESGLALFWHCGQWKTHNSFLGCKMFWLTFVTLSNDENNRKYSSVVKRRQ